MSKRKVKEYDPNRGTGKIIDHETGQKLTVYRNYINKQYRDTLQEGQEIEYDIENDRSRNWAINVKILE